MHRTTPLLYMESKLSPAELFFGRTFVPYFVHLCVLILSQKHRDYQFSMILQQFTSYLLVRLENFNLQYPPNQ